MSDPINSWLTAQRELTERWLSASKATDTSGTLANGTADHAQKFWDSVTESVSPQARELAEQLAQLGPMFLAGASDALSELFAAPTGQEGAQPQASFSRWLELAPIGYFREHQAHAQALARALDEYRRVALAMTTAIARIHAEALEALAKKVAEMSSAGKPITDSRSLYNLWIECAEQSFAQHARSESFGRLQGELVNAGTHVRAAQQTIAEYFLKSLDLPTRAELNSIHRRLKDLRERLEEVEARSNSSASIEGRRE